MNCLLPSYSEHLESITDALDDHAVISDLVDSLTPEQFVSLVIACDARMERESLGCLDLQ